MLTPAKDLEKLAEQLRTEGVEYLMASFSDMHGVSKTKMVPLSHLDQMMEGSELYTGAALDGVPQDVSDEEVSARSRILHRAALAEGRGLVREQSVVRG